MASTTADPRLRTFRERGRRIRLLGNQSKTSKRPDSRTSEDKLIETGSSINNSNLKILNWINLAKFLYHRDKDQDPIEKVKEVEEGSTLIMTRSLKLLWRLSLKKLQSLLIVDMLHQNWSIVMMNSMITT